jgi:phosphatidylglycerol---prolipoprotein diacylglyceryl transferase
MHPVLFTIGSIKIYSYGVMLAIAFLLAFNLASRRCELFGVKKDSLNNLAIILLISGITGARLLYVFSNWHYFAASPLDVFMISSGGLVFYGGLIFSSAAGIIYAKRAKLSILDAADLIIPFLALGHSIGRIGCFLNGCCFGKPTDSIFGICFPHSIGKVYPTQLFSSMGLFFIFILLLYIQKKRVFKGEIISIYLILYGTFRFFIEFLRGDFRPILYTLSLSQVISMFSVLSGVLLFYILKQNHE